MTGDPSSEPGPDGREPAPERVRAARFKLGRRARRLTVFGHVIAAIGWLGIDVVIGVLAVTGFVSDDPGRVAASYIALDTFATPLLLVFGLSTLGSGLLLGWTSRWGVFRYWWVATKLVLNLVLSTLVLVLLQPRLTTAGREATEIDSGLADRLGQIPLDLLFPAFVSGAALLFAAVLGFFKPWGPTPLGRRTVGTARSSDR